MRWPCRTQTAASLTNLVFFFIHNFYNAQQDYVRQNPHCSLINTFEPLLYGRHFPDIFKCIFFNENVSISIKISLSFVPNGPINDIPALDQIMACRRPGDKPLPEPMMASLLTHICVTRPQWVKYHVRYVCVQSKSNIFPSSRSTADIT